MSNLFANKPVQGIVYHIGSEFDNLTVKLFKKLIISAQRELREQKYFSESRVNILLQINVSVYPV
jgi:hypothetical protein